MNGQQRSFRFGLRACVRVRAGVAVASFASGHRVGPRRAVCQLARGRIATPGGKSTRGMLEETRSFIIRNTVGDPRHNAINHHEKGLAPKPPIHVPPPG